MAKVAAPGIMRPDLFKKYIEDVREIFCIIRKSGVAYDDLKSLFIKENSNHIIKHDAVICWNCFEKKMMVGYIDSCDSFKKKIMGLKQKQMYKMNIKLLSSPTDKFQSFEVECDGTQNFLIGPNINCVMGAAPATMLLALREYIKVQKREKRISKRRAPITVEEWKSMCKKISSLEATIESLESRLRANGALPPRHPF